MKNLSPEQHRHVKHLCGCKAEPPVGGICCSSGGGTMTAEGGLDSKGGDV